MREGELQHRGPHLGADPAALIRRAEPAAGGDRPLRGEVVGADALDADERAFGPDAEVDLPRLRPPRLAQVAVVADEQLAVQVVCPRHAEGHLLRRVDPGRGDLVQLLDGGVVGQAELQPWRPQPESRERREVHPSSRCGLPSPVSSAMSRRKKSDVVQSTTTRSFRENSGSWKRWYVRVTNQPGKPRRRKPITSAIPL